MKVDLDFTNVKSSKKIRVPEGDYVVKVKAVKKGKSSNKGTPHLSMQFLFITGGPGVEGKTIIDDHYLTENSLWTLRNMLEAMGYKVPASKMTFQDKMVLNKKVGITVIDGEEYKGRTSSEIADYVPVDVVGNRVSADDESGLDVFAGDDDEEDTEEEDDDQQDSFSFDDDEEDEDEDEEWEDDEEEDEDETEEIALSFDANDVESAKGAQLKEYVAEAREAGFEISLPKKAKVSQVRSALAELFEDEEEDDDEMEDFDLDDVE